MTSAIAAGRFAAACRNLSRLIFHSLFVMAVTLCAATGKPPPMDTEPGPSVTDIVEFNRVMAPVGSNEDQLREQVSPDGTRAFILTRKANTRTDRNRYEILLLDLRPQRLAAGRYVAPVSVASLEPVVDDYSGFGSVTDLRWVGNRTIIFRARLRDALYQAFQVDTVTRALTQLTFSPTGVIAFAVSDDLRTVLYAARVNNPPLKEGQRSIVVGNQSFWSVMRGQESAQSQLPKYRYHVAERGHPRHPRKLGEDVFETASPFPLMSLSPDGRWAVLPHDEPQRQQAWIKDYPLVDEATQSLGPGLLRDPMRYHSRPSGYVPMRMLAYRLSDGAARAVVDAPHGGTPNALPRLLWQAGGRSLVIAGTHLPLQGHELAGSRAAHIVEFWPEAGRWEAIAEVKGRVKDARQVSRDLFQATDDSGPRRFERRGDRRLQEIEVTGERVAAEGSESGWKLRIHQSLNTPPDIVAEGPAGALVPLTRLNPHVSPAWGSMRAYDWKDPQGRQWKGGLMVPAGYQPGARRPLVIQTYGFHPTHFYLDGGNQAERLTSAFAGRAFLRAGLLVLAVPVRASTGVPEGDRERIAAYIEGVRAAIEALVADGTVDRERVGIIGWSTTGERVLNQITFTDAPIRAATLADGDANTLFSTVVTYGFSDHTDRRKERANGGRMASPAWIRNDPSMHTDCINAAVRIETYGASVKNNWDIYSLVRRQFKAVEMVIIPKGTHGLHTPSERLLSLQGNVDWFRFWLTGEERTEPYLLGESDETLREQYRQWRQMAAFKKADDAKPVCARKAGLGHARCKRHVVHHDVSGRGAHGPAAHGTLPRTSHLQIKALRPHEAEVRLRQLQLRDRPGHAADGRPACHEPRKQAGVVHDQLWQQKPDEVIDPHVPYRRCETAPLCAARLPDCTQRIGLAGLGPQVLVRHAQPGAGHRLVASQRIHESQRSQRDQLLVNVGLHQVGRLERGRR